MLGAGMTYFLQRQLAFEVYLGLREVTGSNLQHLQIGPILDCLGYISLSSHLTGRER